MGMDYWVKLFKISVDLDSGHQTLTGSPFSTNQSLPYLFFFKHNLVTRFKV